MLSSRSQAVLVFVTSVFLTACGGGSDSAVSGGGTGGTGGGAPTAKLGVVTGFNGNLGYEGEAGAGDGVGDGADGEGGIGAGGSLGRFYGATVFVFLPDGSELGHAEVGASTGLVTIYPGRDYAGPLFVEVRGAAQATYYDEALQQSRPFLAGEVLRARVGSNTGNIGVTALTEAAVSYMIANPDAGGTTAASQITHANQVVRTEFNAALPKAYQLTRLTRLPTMIGQGAGQGSAPNTPAGNYAVVVAAMAELAHANNSTLTSPAQNFAQQLALDFTDGLINDVQKNGAPVAPENERSYAATSLSSALLSAIGESSSQLGDPADQPALPASSAFGYYLLGENVRSENATTAVYEATLQSNGTVRAKRIEASGEDGPDFIVATDIKSLRSGADTFTAYHAMLMRKKDGTVLGIGSNRAPSYTLAQLTPEQTATAIEIPALRNFRSVKFGADHQIGLDQSGKVYTWGSNNVGQLNGQESQETSSADPREVALNGAVRAVGGSNGVSVAVMRSGQVQTWGSNEAGLLGRGQLLSFVAPGPVQTATGFLGEVIAIASSNENLIAVRADGSLWGWGQPGTGLLGVRASSRAFAAPLDGLPGIRKVIIAGDGAYGLSTDHTVWYWGLDADGQQVQAFEVAGVAAVRDLAAYIGVQGTALDVVGARALDQEGLEIILLYGVRQ